MDHGSTDAAHTHSPHLAHHFETPAQQFASGKLGMWLFLATEVLLFGGLFCAYGVYRSNHPEIFIYAHQFLDKTLGGVNTIVLICSSLTMAWAVRAAQLGRRTSLIVLLILTLACACGFLGIKYVEYKHKWEHHLVWGERYIKHHPPGGAQASTASHAPAAAPAAAHATAPANVAAKPAAAAPAGEDKSVIAPAATGPPGLVAPQERRKDAHDSGPAPRNVQTFFAVYFAMTGLHGLHVVAGMAVILWLLIRSIKGHFGPEYFTPVDLGGLYWHLVDLIWIFLFPLLYLIH